MKKRNLTLFIFCLLGLCTSDLLAQKGTVASGGEASGTGGKISYSVGQIDYINATGSNGAITQGLQQPYEIQVMTGVDKTSINLTCSIYPNPVTDVLRLSVENITEQNMTYALFTIDGKHIAQQKISDNQTEISFIGMANGFYLIKVFNSNNEVKTSKISKNQ